MTSYTTSDIQEAVRIAIDENRTNESLLTDSETLKLNEIIESKIVDGVRMVAQIAPNNLIDVGSTIDTANITWENSVVGVGYGFVQLPDDFMRLLSFQMSDWIRPVVETITESDKTYAMQHSKYTGLRGNVNHPVCAVVRGASGKVLEFYSCSAGSTVTVKMAQYIAYPKIANGSIPVSSNLYRPSVYYIAGLVLAAMGNKESETMYNIANSIINDGSK